MLEGADGLTPDARHVMSYSIYSVNPDHPGCPILGYLLDDRFVLEKKPIHKKNDNLEERNESVISGKCRCLVVGKLIIDGVPYYRIITKGRTYHVEIDKVLIGTFGIDGREDVL